MAGTPSARMPGVDTTAPPTPNAPDIAPVKIPSTAVAASRASPGSIALVLGASAAPVGPPMLQERGRLPMERGAHRFRDLVERFLAAVEHGEQTEEAVDLSVVAMDGGRHTGGLELAPVRLALVAQRVELGGDHERGREPAVVGGPKRGRQRVRHEREVAGEVVTGEPVHGVHGEEV